MTPIPPADRIRLADDLGLDPEVWPLLNPAQFAELHGVSVEDVKAAVKAGAVEHVRFGPRTVRFARNAPWPPGE